MKKWLIIVALLLPVMAAAEGVSRKEFVYRADDAYCFEQCKMEVTAPMDGKKHPVIVWFHGGGLTGGHYATPKTLGKSGNVVFSAGYRFATKVSVAEIIDDAAAAVAWALEHAEEYGGDLGQVFLAGHSAGAYLVSMLALDKHYLAKYGIDPDTQIAGVVPYSGQAITHFAERQKQGISALTPTIDDLAPIAHLRADAPPMFVISGDRELEMNGRYEENAYFVRMLRLNGHKDVRFVELGGFSHGAMAAPAHYLLLSYIKEKTK